ncbi:uncharacterized protein LOC115982138 isoform X2 [Quercus lobata]|uniref:uncharacterized protein LOC115982138 isoform X2 n=1 Tax=Quercus lobata TaxID=97700 RepID=UPI001246DB6D|nr:uncharacterized protein LOC115982138 isoform X2 [Quercus lobata]
MALQIGKVAVLLGAGIVGSILAQEGRMPTVSDFVSGAFKFVLKKNRQDDSSSSVKKPRNDSLMAQVNSLREELQLLASNGPITIVTTGVRGTIRYGVIIVVVVLGYGYVWWKGWKLPDMMFATRRGLADACNSIAKQLETLYSSISATKRELSSRMNIMDSTLDKCAAINSETQQEVSDLRKRTDFVGVDVINIHDAVQTLETKISRIEGKQDLTNEGVRRLCSYTWNLQNSRTTESTQALPSSSSKLALEQPPSTPSSKVAPSISYRPALEQPPVTPSSSSASLPPDISAEPLSSPSSNGSHQSLQNVVSAPGLKDINVTSKVVEASRNHEVSNGNCTPEDSRNHEVSNGNDTPEDTNSGASSSGRFGLWFPSFRTPFLSRSLSVTNTVLQQSRSSSQHSRSSSQQ